jgi:hypothetical protein
MSLEGANLFNSTNRSITPSRSASSVTAAKRENRVSDPSGVPIRTHRRVRPCCRNLRAPIGVLPPATIKPSTAGSSQGIQGTYRRLTGRVAPQLAEPGSDPAARVALAPGPRLATITT